MTLLSQRALADTRLSQVVEKAAWHKTPRIPMGKKGAGRWHRPALSAETVALDAVSMNAAFGLATSAKSDLLSKVTWVTAKKFDAVKGIVEGLVYEPNVLDSQGEFMTAADLETMAHRFMSLDLSVAIDTQHSFASNGCRPVESFIARKGDPDYPEGSWVMAVQLTPAMVTKYELGEINGFSFAALVTHTKVDVEYETIRDHVGLTVKFDDHEHLYYVQMDENGRIKGGRTDEVNGHTHIIGRASTTEVAAGHSHRYFVD